MEDTKALLFDVFGTVVDWRGSVVREIRDFAARNGLTLNPEAFADAWRGLYQPSMERVRSGEIGWTVLDDLHRVGLDRLLADNGISGLSEAEIIRLNHAWHRLDPWPDSREGLARIRRRYIAAPLSNGNVALMVDLARHGDLVWDAILGAEVARQYKPRPEVYFTAAQLLRLPPESCMMVAAHNDDLRAAASCGMRTAFVARPHEHGPGQTSDLAPAENWNIVAEDLRDLARQLGV
jgi:2-haloacid dehalogenase